MGGLGFAFVDCWFGFVFLFAITKHG